MNIVLIQPPIEDFYSTPIRLQPIGLAYLKAALKKYFSEITVVVRDYHNNRKKQSCPWPKELSFLKEYYRFPDRSPFSTFYHYYHFGADWETIVQDIGRLNPDLVGISSLFTAYAPQALKVAEQIKTRLGLPILMGGSHVSAVPHKVLQQPFVDFVISGEGERPLTAFADEWLGKRRWNKVPNLGFKTSDKRLHFNDVLPNFPLEALPFPDLSDLAAKNYRYGKKNLSFIISSRSCPYHCAFCSVHQTFGHSFRLRSVENIIRELELRWQQGYSVFDFEDDNLTFDLKRIQKLNTELEQHFKNKPVRLMAMNGIAYFRLTDNILEGMYRAGFRDLNISLVSTNQPLLHKMKRPFHLKKFLDMVHKAHQLKMNVISYQILGLPGDSVSSMLKTLIFQAHLPVTIGVSPFYLTPGMPLAETQFKNEGQDWINGRLTSLGATSDSHLREAIYTLFILARIINFLKHLSLKENSTSLDEILSNRNFWNGRDKFGLEALWKLIDEEQMFAVVGNEFKPLTKFRYEIFKNFKNRVKFIKRIDGGEIKM